MGKQSSDTTKSPMGSSYYEAYWQNGLSWSPSQGAMHPIEQRFFQHYLKPGMACLDYGCGDGKRYGHFLTQQGVIYHGFDISETAVARGRANGLNLQCLSAEGKAPIPDASCTVALCFEVLEHLMDPEQSLIEIRRILSPHGIALLSVPNSASWFQRLEFFLTGFFNPGGSPLTSRKKPWNDAHIRFFNPSLFKRLVKESGFNQIQLIGSRFSFSELPYLYKKTRWHRILNGLSWPLAWLGWACPSLFSTRLFIITRR